MHQGCTRHRTRDVLHQGYTRDAPGMYQGGTRDAAGMQQGCTRHAPGDAPWMHQECTRHAPGRHQGCIRDAHFANFAIHGEACCCRVAEMLFGSAG